MKKRILKIILFGILSYPIACIVTIGDGSYIDSHSGPIYYITVLVAVVIATSINIAYVIWKHYKKLPSKKVTECNAYVIGCLKEASAPYEEQIKSHLEATAWNLSNKIAEKWQNMDHYIQVLYASGTIDDEIKDILEKIRDHFARYSINGDRYDPEIWTPQGLETSHFWAEQRRLAKEALQLMSAKDRQKESIIQK